MNFKQFLGEADDWESIFKSLKTPSQPPRLTRPKTDVDPVVDELPKRQPKTQHPKYRDGLPAEPAAPLGIQAPTQSSRRELPAPTPTNGTTAVAPLNQAMGDVVPAGSKPWQYVKDLPGYMSNGIRELGRQVFSSLTSTPIEQIQVMANLQGRGPTDQGLLDRVVNHLEQNGRRLQDMEFEAQELLPGYGAKVRMYSSNGYTFMAVKDQMGKYVYGWKDANALGSPQDRPSLPNR